MPSDNKLNWIYRVEIKTPVDEDSRKRLGDMIQETVALWVGEYGGDVDVMITPGLMKR